MRRYSLDVPDTAGPTVEVCIVSYNSADVLAAALRSIEAHLPDATVAIREHGDDPEAIEQLVQIADASSIAVTVSVDSTNPGFGTGCNGLATTSTATWLLFLNPDAEILAWPWSDGSHTPPLAIVGPHMDGVGETERQSGLTYRIRDEVSRSWLRRSSVPTDGRGFVSGAALLIERQAFERLDGFDENYFMFYEDIDLCLRANELGIATLVEPMWRVRHSGGHATKGHFERSLVWSYESALRFHASRGSSTRLYRMYVAADGAMRSVLHLCLRHREQARAYRQLVTMALRG